MEDLGVENDLIIYRREVWRAPNNIAEAIAAHLSGND